MNAPFDLRLDKATFKRWVRSQDRKYEWKDGRVVQMNNVTRGHANIVMNIARGISSRVDLERWSVVVSDFGVEDETFLRFPDVIVEPVGGDPHGRRADHAVLLVEVLSPSSVDTDMLEKPEEYMSLPTVEAYVVVSQDEAICWIWTRDPATKAFPPKPAKVQGRDQALDIACLAVTLPLAEIYRGIPTAEDR